MTSLTLCSKPNTLAKRDGRTREARLVRKVRAELTDHVGGNPSATQRALIERCVSLTLRIAAMDEAWAAGAAQSDYAAKSYLGLSNALNRTVRELGMRPAAQRGPTLAEHLAATHKATAA